MSLKMYFGLERTRSWMAALAAMVQDGLGPEIDLFVMPSFLSLHDARAALAGTGVGIGAQDVFWEECGAYTGEVSAPMLVEAGCRYVEIGHAERRRLFHENDAVISRKMQAAARAGLIPVLCVGEASPMSAEAAAAECARQIETAVAGIDRELQMVVAYEPVWAIGADRPPAATAIIDVATRLRLVLADRPETSLIYGGSAGPGLLASLGDAVDGLFLGRYAHDIEALRAVLAEARPGLRHGPAQG